MTTETKEADQKIAGQPVFVLTAPRSFSSIVTAMIGQHPDLCGLPETHLFVADTVEELLEYYEQPGPRNKRRADGLARAIAELVFGKQTEGTVFLAKNWIKKNGQVTTRQVMEKLMKAASPRRIVEKSVTTTWNEENVERCISMFPDAYFIHLIRHPRSFSNSYVKLVETSDWKISRGMQDYSTKPPTFDPQFHWQRVHYRIYRALEAVPEERWLQVRGEEVLENPKTELPRILDWLGLPADEKSIEAMLHPEESPFAKIGPDNAPFGSDHLFLKNPEFRPGSIEPQSLEGALSWRSDIDGFRDEVKDLASRFGYT